MKKDKLLFGLIGCGRIGFRHAEHISKLGELVCVADTVVEKAEEFASKFRAKSYPEHGKMLVNHPEVDVVAVCSPNGLHALHSINSLKSGKHVLCEKPMALSTADCAEMIREAEYANKRLFVVKQNRFNPPVEAVKRALAEGRLGRIFSVQLNCFWNRNEEYYRNSWKGTKSMDGGTLYTQFSHFIEVLYWLVGDIESSSAIQANNHKKGQIQFEDFGVVNLRFQSGALGNIQYTVNAYGKNMEGSLVIFGEKGTVKIGGQYLNELEYQNIEGFKITDLPAGNPANQYGQYQGSMSNHDKVYENVIDVLLHEGKIATHGYEGLKTVEIISRIYKNAEWIE